VGTAGDCRSFLCEGDLAHLVVDVGFSLIICMSTKVNVAVLSKILQKT